MKTATLKTLAAASGLAVLASLSVLPAYADVPKDESLFLSATNFESIKNRDQVQQEYVQAMNDGSLVRRYDRAFDPDKPLVAKTAPSNLARQDVYAETVEWLRTKGASVGMGD